MQPILTIDTDAIVANWRTLNALSDGKVAAVVKANAYGLGVDNIAPALADAGVRRFFVATSDEARNLAKLLQSDAITIYELSGYSAFAPRAANIVPIVNNLDQYQAISGCYGIRFDTGMSRFGLSITEIDAIKPASPSLVMSHLACADEPSHTQNRLQLANYQTIKSHFPDAKHSLAATGGILLGRDYHFDLTRPGIGIYGGAPFMDARPVMNVEFPVVNIRMINTGTAVGYGADYRADKAMRIATVLGGYADGITRNLAGGALFHNDIPCPIIGRISMDGITVDISDLNETPSALRLLGPNQDINQLAEIGDTIAYELFTNLGSRYKRVVGTYR